MLRYATALLSLTLTVACAQRPAAPPPPRDTSCSEPRPQVCTMIYAPVCAVHADGSTQTHASACNACADDSVVGYRSGDCDEEKTQ
jgi:hypothetical protein